MPTSLSVNVNKVATLRNARGDNIPSVVDACKYILQAGADGITVHPRPDERHIRYQDVYDIKSNITAELNIEGNPKFQQFVDLVIAVKPTQVTLVPDHIEQLTSDHGWNTVLEYNYLSEIVSLFQSHQIRTSIFVDAQPAMVEGAAKIGVDRVELYTKSYANQYAVERKTAIAPYQAVALLAQKLNIGVNAGHDLSLNNLAYFIQVIPTIAEVSIGHALVADALYFGWEKTIHLYKEATTKYAL